MSGYRILWLFLIPALLMGGGCDPAPRREAASSAIEGLTLFDLQAERQPEIESLLSFSVLTYILDADAVTSLETVIDSLSQQGIRYDNAEAFEANGFSVALGTHEEGAAIAQTLRSIGAVRVSQGALMIPTNSHEILYGANVTGSRSIIYSTSATGVGGAAIGTGKAGWVISGQRDEVLPDVAQVALCPAFWEIGASDLRLLAGQEPYEFRFFDVGRISVPMEAGQICLLGPERIMKDQDTLNRILFEDTRQNRVRFFVIIFGGPRTIDGD